MRWLFSITAPLSLAVAVAWLFAPHLMLGLWSLQNEGPHTVYMARRFGGMFLGYALLLWLAREEPRSRATFAICAASATMMGSSCLLSAYGALTGAAGSMGWVAVVIEGAGFSVFTTLSHSVWRQLPSRH